VHYRYLFSIFGCWVRGGGFGAGTGAPSRLAHPCQHVHMPYGKSVMPRVSGKVCAAQDLVRLRAACTRTVTLLICSAVLGRRYRLRAGIPNN
jgi:hypothetical protein